MRRRRSSLARKADIMIQEVAFEDSVFEGRLIVGCRAWGVKFPKGVEMLMGRKVLKFHCRGLNF